MELFHFLGMFTLEIFMENIQGITLFLQALHLRPNALYLAVSQRLRLIRMYQVTFNSYRINGHQLSAYLQRTSACYSVLSSQRLQQIIMTVKLCFKAEEMRSIEQIMYCVLTPYANFRYLVQRICIYQELSQILKCDQQHQ